MGRSHNAANRAGPRVHNSAFSRPRTALLDRAIDPLHGPGDKRRQPDAQAGADCINQKIAQPSVPSGNHELDELNHG